MAIAIFKKIEGLQTKIERDEIKKRGRYPGIDVVFPLTSPRPKLWLKSIVISGKGKQDEQITGQQSILQVTRHMLVVL